MVTNDERINTASSNNTYVYATNLQPNRFRRAQKNTSRSLLSLSQICGFCKVLHVCFFFVKDGEPLPEKTPQVPGKHIRFFPGEPEY